MGDIWRMCFALQFGYAVAAIGAAVLGNGMAASFAFSAFVLTAYIAYTLPPPALEGDRQMRQQKPCDDPHIQYETRCNGTLFVAYSEDLPGLLVCGHSREEVDNRLPRAIAEINEAIRGIIEPCTKTRYGY